MAKRLESSTSRLHLAEIIYHDLITLRLWGPPSLKYKKATNTHNKMEDENNGDDMGGIRKGASLNDLTPGQLQGFRERRNGGPSHKQGQP